MACAVHSPRVPPSQLSHYRIIAPLGRGAMGEVYRAVDQRLGREVAIKMLPREVEGDPDWQTRLLREAQAASALNHPGIVTLYDIAADEGRAFLVMELVIGEPCSALARRGVPWRRALELTAAVADALAAAHGSASSTRDVKSDNLMVTPEGQVKVLDFGLAKLRADLSPVAPAAPPIDETQLAAASLAETLLPASSTPTARAALSSDLTQAGHMVGTPAYMAPECYDGQADPKSEVFALGVVAYELLAGQRPFDRDSAIATMAAIRIDAPAPPSKVAPTRRIPARVDRVILRALAKAPDARFPDMAAFAAALRSAARPVRRRYLIAAAALALLGGGGAAWALTRTSPAAPPMVVTASKRLTLDDGCEEYPRLTPDGQRVIYDGVADGDYELFAMTLADGARTRLTHQPGWDYAAALAPDGRRVAFVHETPSRRTVMALTLGSDAQPVTLGAISGYPTWSHDGALIVGDPGGRILRWELGPDLRVAREVELGHLPAGGRAYHLAAVAGDGVAVLWWTASDVDETALGELDRDGRLRIVEEARTDYEGGLAAAATPHSYYVTRKGASTGNQLLWRRFGRDASVVVPGGLSPQAGVDVARDGTRLVFSTCMERQYVARLRPGAPPTVLSRGEWQDVYPAPIDARTIIVTSNRRGDDQGWALDTAGGAPRAVTPVGAVAARASHDGRTLVYAADGGRGGLARVPLAGGAPTQLTREPSDAAPTFSHDDQLIVFGRTTAGRSGIYAIPASGGGVRHLADGGQPTASPVDDRVAFLDAPDADGARAILVTTTAGAPPTPIPGVGRAAWLGPRFSPDGRHLVAVRGFQEVVELTLDGSAPPRVLWTAATNSVLAIDYMPDGDGYLASLADYTGDVWLAEGRFR
jgi:Tol biopolymer transport system component